MTQKQRILNHLQTHKKGITSLEAFERYGVSRLSAVIFELRRLYNISTDIVEGKNRYGDECFVARYTLDEGHLARDRG